MGLEVNTKYSAPVVHHGGDMIGFHSDMVWLPEQNVGAVVLTNSDPGWILRSLFQRKPLEVLFDGKAEAASSSWSAAARSAPSSRETPSTSTSSPNADVTPHAPPA